MDQTIKRPPLTPHPTPRFDCTKPQQPRTRTNGPRSPKINNRICSGESIQGHTWKHNSDRTRNSSEVLCSPKPRSQFLGDFESSVPYECKYGMGCVQLHDLEKSKWLNQPNVAKPYACFSRGSPPVHIRPNNRVYPHTFGPPGTR